MEKPRVGHNGLKQHHVDWHKQLKADKNRHRVPTLQYVMAGDGTLFKVVRITHRTIAPVLKWFGGEVVETRTRRDSSTPGSVPVAFVLDKHRPTEVYNIKESLGKWFVLNEEAEVDRTSVLSTDELSDRIGGCFFPQISQHWDDQEGDGYDA